MTDNLCRLPLSVRLTQIAEDASLYKSSTNLTFAKNCIETNLRSNQWFDVNGFLLSPEKTQAIVFTRLRLPDDSTLFHRNILVTLEQVVQFIGLFFTQGYFGNHVNNLLDCSQKGLNTMSYLTGTDWDFQGSALVLCIDC